MKKHRIPLWVKISYSIMVAVVVPVYLREYGPTNFLWFCDIAMLLMLPGLWLENRLIASMMALGVLPLEMFWFLGFFTGGQILSIADYMFDPTLPLYLRALSLFHFPMPIVIIMMLIKYGYDKRALKMQIILVAILLPLTRWLTPEKENINWVYQPEILSNMPTYAYIILITITLILALYIPVHALLKKCFPIKTRIS